MFSKYCLRVGRFGDTFKQKIVINSHFLITNLVLFPLYYEMHGWKLAGRFHRHYKSKINIFDY